MTSLIRGENTTLPTAPLTVNVAGVASGTVDLLIFQLDATGRVRGDDDLIFYNQPVSREEAVRLLGTGTGIIDLRRAPAEIHTVRVAVALDDSAEGSLAMIRGLGVEIEDASGHRIDAAALGLTSERAAVLVELYRRDDRWKIRNVSAGWDRGLAALVEEHGVAINEDAAPAPQVAAQSPTTPPPSPSADSGEIVLVAHPVKKTFTTRTAGRESHYSVPDGFEMLHFDLEHMFDVALTGSGIDPEGTWWELSFDTADEVNEYTISTLTFTCRPGYRRVPYGVRITFEEGGMTSRYGYRPGLDFPEGGGGVSTGPRSLHSLAFDGTV